MRAGEASLGWALVALLLALAPGCSGETAPTDAGTDAPDADDDAFVPNDGGPWPAFQPRLIVSRPDVVCEPSVPIVFRDPGRPPAPPGTVRFIRSITADPDVYAGLVELFSAGGQVPPRPEISQVAFTGLPNGGVAITTHGGERPFLWFDAAFIGLDPGGSVSFVRLGPTADPQHDYWMDPGPYPVVREGSDLWGRDMGFLGGASVHPLDMPDLPRPQHFEFVQAVAESRAAIFTDRGYAVWLAYAGWLVSTCLDGRIRWILEYDPRHLADGTMVVADPTLMGLADGSVVASIGIGVRVGPDGQILATGRSFSRAAPCGLYSSIDATHAVWLDPGTLEISGDALPNRAEFFYPGLLGERCQFGHLDGSHAPHTLESFGTEPDLEWRYPLPDTCASLQTLIPVAGGGFLGVCRFPGAIYVQADGTLGWYQDLGDEAGDEAIYEAAVLMPDGTLYFGVSGGLTAYGVVAMETGLRPAWQTGRRAAGNWARLGAPLLDSAVDAGAAEDAGLLLDASEPPDAGPDAM